MSSLRRIGLIVVTFTSLSGFSMSGGKVFGSDIESRTLISADELGAIPVIEIDPLDLDALRLEDEQRRAVGLPLRFAVPHEVHINPSTHGLWLDGAEGTRLWRLRIRSVGATSINLGFRRYVMTTGGSLSIISADQRSSIRPFTAQDNETHGELWVPILPSDDIIVEVVLPKDEVDILALELSSINIGYRGFGALLSEGGARSGSCNVDVVCPEGDPWQLDIKCVGVISTGGFTFCTGFMVNNTAGDLKPMFMTANHCGIDAGNAASLVVFWNFENTVCRLPGSPESGGPGDGPLTDFQTGSFFRAGSVASDFTLVELDEDPLTVWDVGFCGWDATGADASSAVAIHHPSTDEKRISFENDPTTTTAYLGETVPGDGTHVRITDWDLGTTEGGSSGSPLFNQDHHIIGQLHGGFASCSSQTSDWYGKFSISWTGGGTPTTRLSDWLDPISTGNLTLDFLSEATLCTDAGTIALDRTSYACDGTALVKVLDCGLDTNGAVIDTVTVTVSSDSEPGGESVVLTETLPDSAKFEGTISFSTTNSAGVVLVAAGDTVTATYVDADDGAGGIGIVVTTGAVIDCIAPLISNVVTANIEPRAATVTFDANEPSAGTVRYGLSCGVLSGAATSTGFDTLVSVDVSGLQDATTYFYAVDAEDVAGNVATDDNNGNCFSFTTLDVPNFFTEEFLLDDNDLDNLSFTFLPNGTVDFYSACAEPITALPTDPSGGTTFALGDDDSLSVVLIGGETVSFYGSVHTSFFVGSNGYITFGTDDTDFSESLDDHFALARISLLFDDFNPTAGGTVSWKQLSDRVAVTYENIPEFNTTTSNTFQLEMFFEGDMIRISYLSLAATDGIAGLSEGLGLSPDFLETDLSASGICCSDAGVVSLNRTSYACDGTALVKVIDCGLDTNGTVIETITVTVSSDSEPGGESVILTETLPDSAKFEGAVSFSTTNSAGVVLVAAGDTVTATYVDADDGAGGIGVVVTDGAVIDCIAPLISNVQTTNIETRTATVTFDANEPSAGTVRYGLSCGALNGTATSTGFGMLVSVDVSGLQDVTTYFYAVDAEDVAGNVATDDNNGNCYSFTTLEIPDFFTEEFLVDDNDLDNLSFTFIPNGTVDFYSVCTESITALPTDPTGGTAISLSDDDFFPVTLTGGETVSLYGNVHTSFFVGSNGYITFDTGDTDVSESPTDHFDLARISLLFDDFNPSAGGTVSWKQLSDRVAVTYENVPEFDTINSNTFQVEMFFADGTIRISYLSLSATDGLAGLSEGLGLSPDFLETDLSASDFCGPSAPLNAAAPHDQLKNRYISFTPNNPGLPVKLKVALTDSLPHPLSVGGSWWVQAPISPVPNQFPRPALGVGECVSLLGPEATAAEIDWDTAGCQTLHVTGCPIEPTSEYEVQAVIGTSESATLSVLTILQPGALFWGDTVGIFDGAEWTPPNGTTNIDDAAAGIKTFQGGQVVPPGPVPPGNVAHLSVPDVDPGNINLVVNINDVLFVILAFQGNTYPFGPADTDGNCP